MTKKIDYMSYACAMDGTNYCSGVETLAENLIEDNEEDAVIVFPSKDGWAGMRSTSYRMTTDNAEAVLPLPIYKIKKFLIRPVETKIVTNMRVTSPGGEYVKSEDIDYKEYKDGAGNAFDFFDATEYLVTGKEWQSFAYASEISDYLSAKMKDNTLYWEEGSDKIPILGTSYKIAGDWVESMFGLEDAEPVYVRLLRTILYKFTGTYTHAYLNGTEQRYASLQVNTAGSIKADVRKWQFRIEYVPVTSKTKMRARKQAKTNVEYLQPFNQRAEINAVSAFGKSMYLTAQKTGTQEIAVVKNYTKLADVPPLGARVRHNGRLYRLVANHYKQTNTVYIQVTHVLSENWTNKSKRLSVDQKYRNWNIPQDILWRNLYWEDYLICSTKELTIGHSSVLGVNQATMLFACGNAGEYGNAVNNFFWLFDDAPLGLGVTVPCSTYGTANSMIFSASFKDNLSAGLHKLSNGSDLCEETYYCQENGTLQSATVILSSGIGHGIYNADSGTLEEVEKSAQTGKVLNDLASVVYPCVARKDEEQTDGSVITYTFNAPKSELFRAKFKILKDAGEALKFTYQVHIMPYQDDVGLLVVGDKFAEVNTLVKNWESIRTLRLVFLTSYLREGGTRLLAPYTYDEQTENGKLFTYAGDKEKAYIKLNTAQTGYTKAKEANCTAWAICDENNNLIIGCNDISKTEIYFYTVHKR